ncbi:MAG: S8 family peptidase [Candidatus Delongbacteria bacterium]|nr:S8 family peptidase [Candidatus Delongbacteria bacterium]
MASPDRITPTGPESLTGRAGLQWLRQSQTSPQLHHLYWLPDPGAGVALAALPGSSQRTFRGTRGAVWALDEAELRALLKANPGLEPGSVERCQPALDEARIATGAEFVLPGTSGSLGLSGAGVVVGMVDTGIDPSHPDFRDAQGHTRILAYWDQVEGRVWSQAELDAGSVPNRDDNGHGTHVAGIAAGSGLASQGQFGGFAPQANLLIVRTTFLESDVLSGVQWVFQQAQSRDLPAVVNLSLESHIGPHDGSSWFEQELSDLTGPGRLLCVAAGNNAVTGIHSEAGYGQSIELAFTPEGQATAQLAAYVSSTDGPSLSLIAPDGTSFGPGASRVYNGTTITFPQPAHRTQDWECMLELVTSSSPGEWRLRISHSQAGSRTVQAWGRALAFASPVSEHTIGMPATADSAISVGSYVSRWDWLSQAGSRQYSGSSRVGLPSLFSGWGPRVDGRELPHLLMPGQGIFAPLSDAASASLDRVHPSGDYWLLQGTSMAAPAMAGGLALLLEARPELGPAEAMALLAETGVDYTPQAGRGLLWLPELMDQALGGFSAFIVTPTLDEIRLSWRLNSGLDGGIQRLWRVSGSDEILLDSLTAEVGLHQRVDTGLLPGDVVRYRLQLLDADRVLQASLLSGETGLRSSVPGLLAEEPWPNPASDALTLLLQMEQAGPVRWALHSLDGSRVLTGSAAPGRGVHPLRLELSGLASGSYLLDLESADKHEQRRISVIR